MRTIDTRREVQLRVPVEILRCPASGEALTCNGSSLVTADGRHRYRVVDGVPILLDPARAPIDETQYRMSSDPEASRSPLRRLFRTLAKGGPSLSLNVRAARNYARLAEMLSLRSSLGNPRVLLVGGATLGEGCKALTDAPGLDIVEVDLAIGPRTKVVCDAHYLPFPDASFDAVASQAVLEHVLDPQIAVAEMHRVLVPDGLVYSEIPFMAQVHEGANDVTRYTMVGHRRLYRWFDEVDSGVTTGPGMALLWSVRYFLVAFSTSTLIRALITRVVTLTLFWLKYFDYYLVDRPGG